MGEGEVCLVELTDGNMGNEDSQRTELKRDHECLVEDTEPDPHLSKKHAKETSNDDPRSEVSNPNVSPTENVSSFHDITSQPAKLESSNQVECGDVTSTCSGNFRSEETIRERHINSENDMSRSELTSQVVMEIPKNVSISGIRKITFKFSKKKEDYDAVAQSATNWTGPGMLPCSFDDEFKTKYPDSIDTDTELHASTDLKGSPEHINSYSFAPSMEMKVSKDIPIHYPTNVKKLLSTHILDGARVKYVSNTQEKELDGIINGGGYVCGCSICNFSRVLSAYEFEQHAGVKTRHPNNHIYMENGKPVYSIIQELKTAPLCLLDEVIRAVAGSAVNEQSFQVWKASVRQRNGITEADNQYNAKNHILPHSIGSYLRQEIEENIQHDGYPTYSLMPKKQVKRPNSSTLNPIMHPKKTAESGTKKRYDYDELKDDVSNDKKKYENLYRQFVIYSIRDNDLHRLLFMPNGLEDGTELAYYVKGQRILGGYKQGNGIVCGCCNTEISPSQFESHAGMAARRQPYRHIYTSKGGVTLHDIAISIANGQKLSSSVSDDMCTLCGDGGNLVLCDRCPRAFHTACLGLPAIPDCGWKCSYCREKFGSRKSASEESSNIARAIKLKLTRVVKPRELEIGGCVVCRAHDFSADDFDDRTVMLCDQCEKEYHVGCLRDSGLCDLKELPKENWFCCNDCSRIYVSLKNSVLEGEKLIPASLSSTIVRKYVEKGLVFDGDENNVSWRILSGKSRCPEDLPLLSRAVAIFRECFDPIVVGGGRDLIPLMVHGRNICGQEFGRMYCVVLTVRSVVVSAGLLRVFGLEVAELPLVATSREHQGKGYFQALLSRIEMLLCSLRVQKLVLPAAEEALSIWTKKFGFRKLTEEQLAKYMREVQLTIFKGTSMLEKEVQQVTE